MFRGVLIRESLVGDSSLDRLDVVDTKVVDISSPAAGQPAKWTVHTFETDDDQAAACAQALADDLAAGPWYVDFNNGDRSYVVFSQRVFTYVRGDAATLRAAQAHAREQGIPESQIDWAVPS
ncbi:MAG: hypothetical protein QNJ75_07495 [Acidimicrobiia bacterium]|nr:hypothetical protein [Acidimicrobiia bacterium]